jgi:uncharacterized protein
MLRSEVVEKEPMSHRDWVLAWYAEQHPLLHRLFQVQSLVELLQEADLSNMVFVGRGFQVERIRFEVVATCRASIDPKNAIFIYICKY